MIGAGEGIGEKFQRDGEGSLIGLLCSRNARSRLPSLNARSGRPIQATLLEEIRAFEDQPGRALLRCQAPSHLGGPSKNGRTIIAGSSQETKGVESLFRKAQPRQPPTVPEFVACRSSLVFPQSFS